MRLQTYGESFQDNQVFESSRTTVTSPAALTAHERIVITAGTYGSFDLSRVTANHDGPNGPNRWRVNGGNVRVRLRPERRSLFILICSVSGLQTCLIGCKAPELRPVKILRVAAATGVIKQHRVHRELLSNRADRVGSLLVYGRIGTRLFSLAPFSTMFFHGVSNEVKGKTPIIHQNPRMKPSPHLRPTLMSSFTQFDKKFCAIPERRRPDTPYTHTWIRPTRTNPPTSWTTPEKRENSNETTSISQMFFPRKQ
ncbi:hypothetical protein DPX16_1314 [Anabarilius grahami]|uniref:Uncharacterized protein n=1 Tax=Anabarilius grahami TaxID=495550 RepID=A0A3N0Y7J2_ANAGA|nr:hypothetical protein DPX16_1314 [Anabarilius grahami]